MNAALRKAAILVLNLDTQSADVLLEQLGDAGAAKVRAAVMELGDVPSEEQRRVISEFVGRKATGGGELRGERGERFVGRKAPAAHETAPEAGVEIDASLAAMMEAQRKEPAPAVGVATVESPPPIAPTPHERFAFLEAADADSVARLLADEHPQTVAAVLAHLPPQRAAEILPLFTAPRQSEILRRIVDLDETSPEIIDEVCRGIQAAVSSRPGFANSPGLATAEAILAAAGLAERESILAHVEQWDRTLAKRLDAAGGGDEVETEWETPVAEPTATPSATAEAKAEQAKKRPGRLAFEDLDRLDDDRLASVFAACDSEVALIALAGASPAFVQRILRHFPTTEAARLTRRMECIAPVPLSDIDRAQRHMAAIAAGAIEEGELQPASGRRFESAA